MNKVKIIYFTLLIALTIIIGCNGNNQMDINSKINEISFLESSVSARKFIETNEFIDVDIHKSKPSTASMSDNDIAKLKAAVYRFYKTVKVENGQYNTSLISARQIKTSTSLYESLYENLLEMNRNIETLSKNKEEVEIPEITDTYLESLLD